MGDWMKFSSDLYFCQGFKNEFSEVLVLHVHACDLPLI